MDDDRIVNHKFCDFLERYVNLRQKFLVLRVFAEKQQKSLKFEHEQSSKMKCRLKNMLRWFMKREALYKASLNNLEIKNKELQRLQTEMERERDHIEVLNNAKVSKLQIEIEFLRTQVVQLNDKYKQDVLMFQDKFSKDEIFKNNKYVDHARSFSEQNIVEKDKSKIAKEHPAFMNRKRKGKTLFGKLPGLKIDKVGRKKRKLFQDDDAAIDII